MKKIYMNMDINTAPFRFLDKLCEQEKITPEMLYPFIDVHRLTQITDFVINICAVASMPKSDVFLDYADVYEAASKNETDKALAKALTWRAIYNVQKKHGIDIYKVWIDRCREDGFRPWISLRMNDCHVGQNGVVNTEKDFYPKALRNGWTLGKEYGYYSECLNYYYPEVRARMLAYIREQASHYDVYGVELDFLREYHCFRYLSADMDECREIMTGFVREVKAIIRECEKIHGHQMKLMIRLPRDIEYCRYYGFDPVAMAKEGLIDVLVSSSRFNGSDSGIDVERWRELCPGVEIIPGIEAALGIFDGKFVDTSKEVSLGLAANYLSYDPAGLYFFNYFITPRIFSTFFSPPSELERAWLANNEPWEKSFATLACAADYETIYKNAIRFVLIPESADDRGGYPEKVWRPIPCEIGPEAKSFDIRTGVIPSGKRCSVILGFEGGAENFSAKLNGALLSDFEKTDPSFIEGIGYQPKISSSTVCYRAKFDESLLVHPVQKLEIKADENATILTWVEINVY